MVVLYPSGVLACQVTAYQRLNFQAGFRHAMLQLFCALPGRMRAIHRLNMYGCYIDDLAILLDVQMISMTTKSALDSQGCAVSTSEMSERSRLRTCSKYSLQHSRCPSVFSEFLAIAYPDLIFCVLMKFASSVSLAVTPQPKSQRTSRQVNWLLIQLSPCPSRHRPTRGRNEKTHWILLVFPCECPRARVEECHFPTPVVRPPVSHGHHHLFLMLLDGCDFDPNVRSLLLNIALDSTAQVSALQSKMWRSSTESAAMLRHIDRRLRNHLVDESAVDQIVNRAH